MVNKLMRRRRGVPVAEHEMVPVRNRTSIPQTHGIYRLMPGLWTSVPQDLAARLRGDSNYEVGDAHLSPQAAMGHVVPDALMTIPPVLVRQHNVTRWPSVVIVVPVYNCPDLLRACSRTVAQTDYPGNWRVIWVDNGSTNPETRELLGVEEATSEVLSFGRSQGFAGAVNPALSGATEEFFVLVNQDCETRDPGWLTALIRWMDMRPNCAVAGAKLLYPDGTLQHAGIDLPAGSVGTHRFRGMDPNGPQVAEYERVPAVTGAVFCVRASTWHELGGLDEAYKLGCEDVDFCLRAAVLLGQETWYVPDSVVTHVDSGVRNSSGAIRTQASRWSTASEHLLRERWGAFIDSRGGPEVAIVLMRSDAASPASRFAWRLANRLAQCGFRVVVRTWMGDRPEGWDEPVLFGSGKIADIGAVEVLVAVGWAGVAASIGEANRRFYLVLEDESSRRGHLPEKAPEAGGYIVLAVGEHSKPATGGEAVRIPEAGALGACAARIAGVLL